MPQLGKSLSGMGAGAQKYDLLTIEDLNDVLSSQLEQNNEASSENRVEEKSSQLSLIDLFRYKSLRWISIICASVDFIIEFIYDGTILSLGKIGVNVYIDQILVGLV